MAAETSALAAEKKRWEEEAKATRGSAPAGDGSQRRVRELEQQVGKLEEELRANYRSSKDHDQTFMQFHKETTDLRAKVEQRDKEVASLQAEATRLREALAASEERRRTLDNEKQRLEQDLREANERRELLVKEVEGWKAQADNSKLPKLQEENNSLIQQLLEQKARAAEMVNEMTDLNQTHETRIKLLEAEVQDLKSGKGAKILEGLRGIATTETVVPVDRLPTELGTKLDAHVGECNVVAFNPLGTQMATGGTDKRIKVWDTKTYDTIHSFAGPNGSVVRLCFSAAGDRLVAGCNDSACYVMLMGQNRMFCTLTGHTEKVWGCGFLGDGRTVVTGAHDRSLRWWDLNTGGRCTKNVLCVSSCNDLAVHPASDVVCTAHLDSQLRIWDPRTFKIIQSIEGAFEGQAQVTSVCITPDGNGVLASGRDGSLKIFDLRTYEATKTFACKEMVASINHYKACMSPDGKYVAAGSSSRLHMQNQTVCVWDAGGRVAARLREGHAGPITCCAWHPDGGPLVSAGHDGKLVVWK